MKSFLTLLVIIVAISSCTQKRSKKLLLLDKLKKEYAGKPVNITLSNNLSNTVPMTSKYAYIDKNKTDLAFKLEEWQKYNLADEEGYVFVATTSQPEQDTNEMVLIEVTNNAIKRGFVHYSFIKEFEKLSYYK